MRSFFRKFPFLPLLTPFSSFFSFFLTLYSYHCEKLLLLSIPLSCNQHYFSRSSTSFLVPSFTLPRLSILSSCCCKLPRYYCAAEALQNKKEKGRRERVEDDGNMGRKEKPRTSEGSRGGSTYQVGVAASQWFPRSHLLCSLPFTFSSILHTSQFPS